MPTIYLRTGLREKRIEETMLYDQYECFYSKFMKLKINIAQNKRYFYCLKKLKIINLKKFILIKILQKLNFPITSWFMSLLNFQRILNNISKT